MRNILRFTEDNLHRAALFCLYLFLFFCNFLWLKLDKFPLLWDAGTYYLESLKLFDLFRVPSFNSLLEAAKLGAQYPPLVPVLVSMSYLVLPRTEDSAVLAAGTIFIGILIFSVYGIARILYDRKAGVLAAFLITMYPLIFGHSRVLMYDLPLAAMVSLAVFLFLKSVNFRDTRYSLTFGAVVGLGLLTKFSFPLFICSALAVKIIGNFSLAVRHGIKGNALQARNLFWAMAISIALASLWYIPNCNRFAYAIFIYPGTCNAGFPPVFSLASFLYYFFSLINIQLSFFLFLVFVAGFFMYKRLKMENWLIPVCWVLFSYLGCMLVRYKSPRYTIAYLPAVAIISAIGLMSIRDKRARALVLSGIVIVSLVQFLAYSFGLQFLPRRLEIKLQNRLIAALRVNSIVLFNQYGGENPLEENICLRPGDWKTDDILDAISEVVGNTVQANIFIIPEDPRLHSPLVSLMYLRKAPHYFYQSSLEDISAQKRDIVITKEGAWLSPPNFASQINRSVKWFERNKGDFELSRKISLPDGSYLLMYKHK